MKLLRLKVVLAAIDDDDSSVSMLHAAHTLAEAAGARLHVVHVEQTDATTEAARDVVDASPTDSLLALFDRANVPHDRTQVHVIAGDPSDVIRALADRIHADVIVLGSHREDRGDERRIGSTALAIATNSWAPCLIVPRGIRLPLTRVLVPVDLSDTARGALLVALSWSSALRAAATTEPTRLTAMYVDGAERTTASRSSTQAHPLDKELDRVRGAAGTWAGVTIEGITVTGGDVAGAIADRARDGIDLVVLGTRGLGVDAVGRLGSVSADVLRRLDVPVLLVPPAVWATTA